MSRSARIRRLLALALVPIALVSFGCSASGDEATDTTTDTTTDATTDATTDTTADTTADEVGEQIAEEIEEFIEDDGLDLDVDADGNVRIESEDGTVGFGQGLPEAWPDDIPLPGGVTVTYGSSNTEGLVVIAESDRSVADVYDDLKASLDGWTVEDEFSVGDADGDILARFIDGERSVSVMVTATDEGSTSVSLIYEAEAA